MKAIRTTYIPCTDTKPSRIAATTGEKGQRVLITANGDWTGESAHAAAARKLCDKMGWQDKLIGGGFPDGSMVWVFETSFDRA